jgi:hypothetical protein
MKRFFITNLLAIMVLPMLACAGGWTTNYYLFSVYERTDFSDRMDEITKNNWKAYLGLGENDYFWFRAEDIIKAAQGKNDALMVSYVQNLDKYLDCAREVSQEVWDYPTKDQINKRNQQLQAIRTYALGKTSTRLRSQHALLYMRCNMLLKRHQDNITFWEQKASQYIETVYKDMMKNIYAGALYKTGQEARAGELFAEMGDYSSLMTLYYLKRSFSAIRQEYLQNPNAKVLPFLLQDFVNNAQEADDATNPNAEGVGGKLFIRDISKKEALQMRDFCGQVIQEGKTATPVLWQSAKAWLEYMFGSKQQAYKDIRTALQMKGTERMEDNARVLHLYISLAEAPASQDYDDWLAKELEWLVQKEKTGDWHFNNVRNRITHQVLTKRYTSQPETVIAMLNAAHSWQYMEYTDTMKVEGLEKYFFYTLKSPRTELDKYLKANLEKEDYALEDLIGTKYMRLCQWDKAIQWLKNVPVSYYEKRGYAVYAANRRYDLGPWIRRQWLKNDVLYSDTQWKLGRNPKLVFATEMQKMEGELNVLSGEDLKKQYYELAVRYAQASFTGDCWFLMRDGKSVMDTVRVNEVDLAAKAAAYLKKAGDPKDFLLKEKVLFARAYACMNPSPWYTQTWNNETYEYDRHADPGSDSYKAFAVLAEFEKENAGKTSGYVSRCDEYDLFLRAYNSR